MQIDYTIFSCLKGEFEAEGLSRIDVAAEALFAARQGLNYLVKISGAEAKSDILYLAELGVSSIVCPMIESPFAMSKYMDMIPPSTFKEIGVTIETITAVGNINDILEAGRLLTEVTIGRTDLTASYGGDSVESERTIDMVKVVARAAKQKGLEVTMGGSISKSTCETLRNDPELLSLLDFVETRKAVMPVEQLLEASGLDQALNLERTLLARRADISDRILPGINERLATLTKRV
jgi:4-hydroxy-2-oxoheptanedioate aldolase